MGTAPESTTDAQCAAERGAGRTRLHGRRLLQQAVAQQRRPVVLGALLAAAHQGGEALVPVLIGVIVDSAVVTGDGEQLLLWLAVLAAVFAMLSTSFRFSARAGQRAAEQATHDLRLRVSDRVLDPGAGAESGHLSGGLVSIATTDARRVGAINEMLPVAVAALSGVLVSAVALLRVSLWLGMLVLLVAPLLLLAAHLLGRPLERRSAAEQHHNARTSGVAADLVRGLRSLKGLGAEHAAEARYRAVSQSALQATLRAARAGAWHDGAILAITGLFIAVVALAGGRLAINGDISIGELIAAVGLAQFLLGPLQSFARVNTEFAQARASALRVAEVLAAPAAVPPPARARRLPQQPALCCRNLSAGPLHRLNFEASPGEMVGVVIGDHAAAAALMDCIGREALPREGSVTLGGVAVTDADPDQLRATLLVAAHEADLFEGSLLDNVAAATARPEDTDTVDAALRAAAADEVAASLPEGIHTTITERGGSLSGGQRQRVALARALAAEADVLVLHEPTTAVDMVTEARVADGIRAHRAGRTTVLLTSNPALLAVTDRVLFRTAGGDDVSGTHHQLLHREPGYRQTVLA